MSRALLFVALVLLANAGLSNPQDYQTFSFDLLVRNDFAGQILPCPIEPDGSCLCPIPSSLVSQGQCAVTGEDVLQVRLLSAVFGGSLC